MKFLFLAFLTALPSFAPGDAPDIAIPDNEAALVKSTDFVEVTGTNDLGGAENFTIHNAQAIHQFVALLTSERFNAVPKSLNPKFKSLSAYEVRLLSKGAVVLEMRIIADSVLDFPAETSFYMQSDRHSDNLLAPLMRLR